MYIYSEFRINCVIPISLYTLSLKPLLPLYIAFDSIQILYGIPIFFTDLCNSCLILQILNRQFTLALHRNERIFNIRYRNPKKS